ncbi:MAG: hypothetical protein IIC60_15160 [Proteobacteria bacterium]|nr:hypothetical protein [Pseudomonadota bacterium]
MKLYKSILLVCTAITFLISGASDLDEKAIEDIFSIFGPSSNLSWQYITEPPAHILALAVNEQSEVDELIRQQAPATYADIVQRESNAQFHSIYSFFNPANNLYRVVWYYQWESRCGRPSFELNFYTYTENGSIPDAETPLAGAGGEDAPCVLHEA